jgi:hypothetical protein
VAFGAGFEEAAFVSGLGLGSGFLGSGLFVGFPGQVDLDAGEVGVESVKDVEDVGSDGIGELVVHRDRAVTVDLNLHGLSLCYLSTKTLVTRTEWPERMTGLGGDFFGILRKDCQIDVENGPVENRAGFQPFILRSA